LEIHVANPHGWLAGWLRGRTTVTVVDVLSARLRLG
jgi:hypothetical protein